MESSNLHFALLPLIPARRMAQSRPTFHPSLPLDGIGCPWVSGEVPLIWPAPSPTSPILTASPVDDFYTPSFSCSAIQQRPRISGSTHWAIHSTSCQKFRCQPMTLVRTSDAYVSGGVWDWFRGNSKLKSIVGDLFSGTWDFTIMCLAGFCIHIHPCPYARSRFQKHLRMRVFGWANWWGNQVRSFGNSLRKLLAILTGCYLWPPRAVADETGRTLVRHKKTTTQNAI